MVTLNEVGSRRWLPKLILRWPGISPGRGTTVITRILTESEDCRVVIHLSTHVLDVQSWHMACSSSITDEKPITGRWNGSTVVSSFTVGAWHRCVTDGNVEAHRRRQSQLLAMSPSPSCSNHCRFDLHDYKRHRKRRGLSLSSSTCNEFPRDFCLCCRHFPSHECDEMCPDVYENAIAFGPSSLWRTDGTVHNNCLDIKRSSIDDFLASEQVPCW